MEIIMKRYFTVFLVLIMVLSLTACGKSSGASSTSSSDYHGEGQVQGGIKSDDELAVLQEEERAGTTDAQQSTTEDGTENNQQSGDSDATPATSGTGHFEDYWQGDNFFDIARYLNDNGCIQINYLNATGSTTDNESEATIYNAYFYGCTWKIRISGTGCYLIHLSTDNNSGTPEYLVTTNGVPENNIRLSNNNNAVCSREGLQIMDAIIQAIRNNPDSLDPLSYTDLFYTQTK